MTLPFVPSDSSFNRANAIYLAHASSIAYCRVPAAQALDRLGLRTVTFSHAVTRTRGYLGVCDTHAVLAFRGTEPITLPNWLTDAVVKLVKCGEYDGRVHHGFSSALRHSWSKVESILTEARGKPLFVTGHSLGGALAVLTACRLAKSSYAPTATYTFGPRVGDADFCTGYKLPTYRVVYGLDLVPEMPLGSMANLLPGGPKFGDGKIVNRLRKVAERIPCYGHVNTFVYVERDGAITMDGAVEPWHRHAVARAVASRGKSFHEGISDHMLTSYIRGLEGQAGKRVDGMRSRTRTA